MKNLIVMPEKKYFVPQGMLKAAHAATGGLPARESLKAALKWLAENPIVPTPEQMDELTNLAPYQDSGNGSAFRVVITEWQRRMFLTPTDPFDSRQEGKMSFDTMCPECYGTFAHYDGCSLEDSDPKPIVCREQKREGLTEEERKQCFGTPEK